MNYIDNCQLALRLLSERNILLLAQSKQRIMFIMLDSKIIVNSDNSRYSLSVESFLDTFANASFYLYKSDEHNSDEAKAKDDEYYSWHTK